MPAPLEATMFAIIPERPRVGRQQSKVWPHVSVMPWVKLGEERQQILETAQGIVDESGPIVLEPGDMITVGARGFEKRAQAVHSEELEELHRKLLGALGSFGINVSHPEWAGDSYFPHITIPHPAFEAPFVVDTIDVIDNRQLLVRGLGTKVISQQLELRQQ